MKIAQCFESQIGRDTRFIETLFPMKSGLPQHFDKLRVVSPEEIGIESH